MKFEYIDGLLTKIRDPVGKEYSLEYDEMNRIVSLNDVTGERRITYHYGDNGDLEEVDLHLEPDSGRRDRLPVFGTRLSS